MSGDCPTGVTQFHCLVNPCNDAKCGKYAAATCVPNYCGGCNADFYVEDSKVNCTCHEEKIIFSTGRKWTVNQASVRYLRHHSSSRSSQQIISRRTRGDYQ